MRLPHQYPDWHFGICTELSIDTGSAASRAILSSREEVRLSRAVVSCDLSWMPSGGVGSRTDRRLVWSELHCQLRSVQRDLPGGIRVVGTEKRTSCRRPSPAEESRFCLLRGGDFI